MSAFNLTSLTMRASELMPESERLVRGLQDELANNKTGEVVLSEEYFDRVVAALARISAIVEFGIVNQAIIDSIQNHDVIGSGAVTLFDRAFWLDDCAEATIAAQIRQIEERYHTLVQPFIYGSN